MVSIPAHLETKGRLQRDVLTSKTERDERRGGVREGHPPSINLPKEKMEKLLKDNVKQKLQVQFRFVTYLRHMDKNPAHRHSGISLCLTFGDKMTMSPCIDTDKTCSICVHIKPTFLICVQIKPMSRGNNEEEDSRQVSRIMALKRDKS